MARSVVVLGGGIAGVEAAIQCRRAGLQVELVSDRDYLFVYPISIWVPVGTLPFEDAKLPLKEIAKAHGFRLTVDRVTAMDAAARQFTLAEAGVRQADHVILALGGGKTRIPGQEHTLSICGDPEQSLQLKARIDALVEKGSGRIALGFGGNPNDPSAVRGGPAFELLFNLDHKLRKLGLRNRFDLTFFAPMAQPGARMGTRALQMMDQQFRAKGFGTRFGVKIKQFEAGGVLFDDGSTLPSDLVMYIPAGAGSELIRASGLPLNPAGFVQIEPSCQIAGLPGWYAVGDVAALEGPEWKAKQGHLAEAMARVAATDLVGAPGRQAGTYQGALSILCLMDMGNGAGLVYRNSRRALMVPLPVIGHWMKRFWGKYYRASKLDLVPRVPGL